MSPRNTVLITGCSTGIGNALARKFHKQGLVVHVKNAEQIIRIRDQVAEITGGKLDILVNNAGQSFLSAAADLDMKRVQDLYNVNVFGAIVSGAALHAYGNTLRIELSPFKCLYTGSVKSDIIETKLNSLPSSSLYKSIESIVLGKRKEVSQGGAMSAEDYAKNVVLEALKANPLAWVWEGSKSWFVWMVDTFLHRTAFDNMMKRWYDMDHIRSGHQT
ncbi:NAD-P-binding protein [Armillaria novae-zelandiae]|uniref:NAD-P-binding protein n=1 Tax=Armillaria novae-zelandiae TaxID=153914 RepID=A0AA39PL94_9AGAR|nr:NAD-P-binding protein [Armillaria novae-zelandiae]